MRKRNTDWFIEMSKEKHGDEFSYEKSSWSGYAYNICITCKNHGDFYMLPANHFKHGQGCPKCAMEKRFDGRYKTRLYRIWLGIKDRCFNSANKHYNQYGGRGIIVSDEFMSFDVFRDYVNSLAGDIEGTKLEIDRIENDGGYERGNIRIATRQVQNTNKRHKSNACGYRGLYRSGSRVKSTISVFDKKISLGSYGKINDAVAVRNKYIIENNLPHKIQIIDAYAV